MQAGPFRSPHAAEALKHQTIVPEVIAFTPTSRLQKFSSANKTIFNTTAMFSTLEYVLPTTT